MSINSTVKPNLKATTGYPKLRITTGGKKVVLFIAEREGTVVGYTTPPSPFEDPIGYHSTTWSISGFKDYHGTVELGNNYD